MINKTLTIGNLAVRFYLPDILKWKFEQAAPLFKTCNIGNAELFYKIKFIRFDKNIFIIRNKNSRAEEIIKNYLKNPFLKSLSKRENETLKDVLLFFAQSPLLAQIIESNGERLNRDFILYGVNSRILILIDTLKREGLVCYYKKFRYWINKAPSVAFCIYFILISLASMTKSFILHSSALKIDGKGSLFIGDSGEGKTTLSKIVLRNVKSARIISDDKPLIVYKNGEFYALRLPYAEKRIGTGKVIQKMKVDKIFFIKKGKEPNLRTVDRYKVLRVIMSKHLQNNFWFQGNMNELPSLLLKFLNKFPPKELIFRKDKSFIELL